MNEYGFNFNTVYFKATENMLVRETKQFNGKPFNVYRFCPTDAILNCCRDIANAKLPYVMGFSQNLQVRSTEQKLVQIFTGVLAETMVHVFLIEVCGIPPKNICRYDLERKDFLYHASEEYDLKIVFGTNQSFIEARNSRRHVQADDFSAGSDYDTAVYIIGQYLNQQKQQESINTLYVRPILQETTRSVSPYNGLTMDSLCQEILNGVSIPYIISGTDASHMFGKESELKQLGQNNTMYRVFSIEKAGDANVFASMVKSEYIKLCSESFMFSVGDVIPKSEILNVMFK